MDEVGGQEVREAQRLLVLEFVVDGAHELLDDVLQGEQPRPGAARVRHHRQVDATPLHLREDLLEGGLFGDGEQRSQKVLQIRLPLKAEEHQILEVNEPRRPISAPEDERVAREARLPDNREVLRPRDLGAQAVDPLPCTHRVTGDEAAEEIGRAHV